ncbi:hypothetical protein PQO01_05015 [Lentisphaera marina]|uniref:hypothetical protein n=1 Tax=Lentisphaera marina TaxID=1111041 RepID=UPI0023660312|nr:hypothetical protein [Lentisphaera marina]MDD7984307.1 hypothetical protein [Lentisphaera marina]
MLALKQKDIFRYSLGDLGVNLNLSTHWLLSRLFSPVAFREIAESHYLALEKNLKKKQ